jgi:Cu(I)/Ag(I) efflux system membrane fusion protein
MFVSAKLETSKVDAYVVPESAVIKVRNTRYVILRTGPKEYKRVIVNGFEMGKKQFAITEGVDEPSEMLILGATLLNERFNKSED